MRIIHLSDLHFGAVDPLLPALLKDAVTAAKPDLVAVSGDLSQNGRKAEYREARAFLDSLPKPLLVVPGNHDMPHGLKLWRRFRSTFTDYQTLIHPELEPVWGSDGAVVAGINSAVPGGWYMDWDRGRISARQLIKLRGILGTAPRDSLRVLVIHHPPAAPPHGSSRHLLDNRAALFGALNETGVDLILSGHFHLSYAVPIVLPGPEPRACVLSVTSTATSSRLRGEPNGFHVIDSDNRDLSVQAWSWSGIAYQPGVRWCFVRGKHRDWHARPEGCPPEAFVIPNRHN